MRPGLLKTFLAVADHRNITRASAHLHLAQSSVSDQVQLLETALGTDLFIRSRTGLQLTPAGEALLPYAKEILALTDEACAAVGVAAGKAAGKFRIGALETIASTRMPQWLTAFRGDHPNIDIQIKVAGSGSLLQTLESGDIDIALCFDRGEVDARFIKRPIASEPLVLVASPDGLSPSFGDGLHVLADERFVTTERGCIYRHLFDTAFAEAGVAPPRPTAEVDSIRTIARLVAAGVGVALVPRLAVADAIDTGDLAAIPWPGPVQTASLVAIWRRRRVQPAVLKQFLASVAAASALVRPADGRLRHAMSSPS